MMLAIQLACLAGSVANMYDVVLPHYRPSCINGCLEWSDAAKSLPPIPNGTQLNQSNIDDFFIDGKVGSTEANSFCAMPGARAGMHEKDCGLSCHDEADEFAYIYDSYAGPWCFCKDPVRSNKPNPNSTLAQRKSSLLPVLENLLDAAHFWG